MAESKKKKLIEIDADVSRVISYSMIPGYGLPINRLYVKNVTDEEIEDVTVCITSRPQFLIPAIFSQEVLPRRSKVRFDVGCIISPVFMTGLNENLSGEITIEVKRGKAVLGAVTENVEVTAFNFCDYSHSCESLAYFVRKTPLVKRIKTLSDKKMQSWGLESKALYGKCGKNDVRYRVASIYTAFGDLGIELEGEENALVSEQPEDVKNLTVMDYALAVASAIEYFGINALVGKIGGEWCVGAFLNDECSFDTVITDFDYVDNKASRGVNDVTLFSIRNIALGVTFEANEKQTVNLLRKKSVDFLVDVKYARMMNIGPLPVRRMTEDGYDLIESREFVDDAPTEIVEYEGDLSGDKTVTREKVWERKLLDLDMRNSLLNFKPGRFTVKLTSVKMEEMLSHLSLHQDYRLKPITEGQESVKKAFSSPFEKASALKPVRDLIAYELKNGNLSAVLEGKDFERGLMAVYRREKSAQEESGTASLYVAVGFLKWNEDGNEAKYAPILLYPATLTKKGSAEVLFYLHVNTEEARINTTLIEYLYQQFNLDVRGLSEVATQNEADLSSVLARFKKEISGMRGWSVYDSVYVCSLSFASYLMWQDVRNKMDKFRESKLIRCLLGEGEVYGANDLTKNQYSSDEAYTENSNIYLPITADSSQFSAISDSLAGKSFVLHGPPGTGKSQTITNIIANNVAAGKRVLFVAEKMAALSVVYKRLQSIGIGDFCLELYSEKTKKNDVVEKLVNTLSLEGSGEGQIGLNDKKDLNALATSLQEEMQALHKKRAVGFSVYEGILGYLENAEAPDCITLDSVFYEKLTPESFRQYCSVLDELAVRAKECGSLEKNPFKDVGEFTPDAKWRNRGESILQIYLRQMKLLRSYLGSVLPLLSVRTTAFTEERMGSLRKICDYLRDDYVTHSIINAQNYGEIFGNADSFLRLIDIEKNLVQNFKNEYKTLPELDCYEILSALGDVKAQNKIAKKYSSKARVQLAKISRESFYRELYKIAECADGISKRNQKIIELSGVDKGEVEKLSVKLCALAKAKNNLYAVPDDNEYFSCLKNICSDLPCLQLEYFVSAYDLAVKARGQFNEVFNITANRTFDLDAETEYVKQVSLNLDRIFAWCKYQNIVCECKKLGMDFMLIPLSEGVIAPSQLLASFKKRVFESLVKSEIALDTKLSGFSGMTVENMMDRFSKLSSSYEKISSQNLKNKLISMIPSSGEDGAHNLERVNLMRCHKKAMKGVTLRNLFGEIPTLMKALCPCMLMSPSSVTQFLDIDAPKFDLVVFDEASQVQTCRAVGVIARAENVIVVGDPKQLPPTTFFGAEFKDDEMVEVEDLDSILDDCLAVGMPERHLLWHYRSHHESLIAFSNAMYYDNKLFTFPSPSDMNSKVTLCYVDGTYDRGGSKSNKKEAEALICDVVERLRDPITRKLSIGIVTFNSAQQAYIEDKLNSVLREKNLDGIAYDRDEPLFVKNLENVQGDERDVILFSVGYGPDNGGKLSLNFGPINQSGGYRRLNVAATRARCEMRVFSSIRSNMIDLSRTNSLGVKGLKAFLEYAEKGRDMLAIASEDVGGKGNEISKFIAKELNSKGFKCDYDVGVSSFKVDVAVADPREPGKYVLAIVCDSANQSKIESVRDRIAMEKMLKTLGWNIHHVWSVNFWANPKREIGVIRDIVNELTKEKLPQKKNVKALLAKYCKPYKPATLSAIKGGPDYVLDEKNKPAIIKKCEFIINAEQPIAKSTLLSKLVAHYNLPKTARNAVGKLEEYVNGLSGLTSVMEEEYFITQPPTTFRPVDLGAGRDFLAVCPLELVVSAKCALECKTGLTREELVSEIITLNRVPRKTKIILEKADKAIDLGLKNNVFIETVDGKFTL